MTATATGTVPAPAIAAFDALERAGVAWCLWRGSPRRAAAAAGRGDFDLLVAVEDRAAMATALLGAGARPARTARPEPGLEDWFALAAADGPVVHLHVHFRMVAGEPRCNRFWLPFAAPVLAGRARADDGVQLALPLHEAALLVLRSALHLRWRDRWPGGGGARLLRKVRGDLAVLLPDGGLAGVAAVLSAWSGRTVRLPAAADLDLAALRALRRAMLPALHPFAAVTGPAAACALWCAELAAVLRWLARRCQWPVLPWRGFCRGGAVVAVRAADSAEATALAASVRSLLVPKFDVVLARDDVAGWRRAQRARARGMLALVPMAAAATVARGAAVDLCFDAATVPASARRARLLGAVWALA